MNVFNIEKAFADKKERGWTTLYVLIDAHGTAIEPGHDKVIFYDGALEVLEWFNRRSDFRTILWTSSHKDEIKAIVQAAIDKGVRFDFINSNPLEANSARACFDRKFYFNIIFDDKAGFEPKTDWFLVKKELQRIGEWDAVDNNENTVIL